MIGECERHPGTQLPKQRQRAGPTEDALKLAGGLTGGLSPPRVRAGDRADEQPPEEGTAMLSVPCVWPGARCEIQGQKT